MKLGKMIGTGLCSILLLTSCFENEYTSSLGAGDAFLAFPSTTVTVSEKDGVANIPVRMTSVGAATATVTFEIVAAQTTAVEGVSYEQPASFTLNFDSEDWTKDISFPIVDNDVFTGKSQVALRLVEVNGVQMGRENTCIVTISDDEHPLAALLGTWQGSGPDGFSPETLNWTVTIEPDEVSLTKVWITNLVPHDYNNYPVYGVVDAGMTTLTVPGGQLMFQNTDGSIDLAIYISGVGVIRTSDIVFTIQGGTLTTAQWVGAHSVEFGGWFALTMGEVLTKQ